MSTVKTKPVTRYEIIEEIRQQPERSEQTEILIDYLQDMWETIDLLRKRFGDTRTQQIIAASSYIREDYILDDDD